MALDTLSSVDAALIKAEAEVERLRVLRQELQRQPLDIYMATVLHNLFCQRDPVENCGWDITTWSVMGKGRRLWLDRSRRLIKEAEAQEVGIHGLEYILYEMMKGA